jgi:hypothetical protein
VNPGSARRITPTAATHSSPPEAAEKRGEVRLATPPDRSWPADRPML